MNTQGASKTLPIIVAAITLASAAFFWKQRETLRTKTQELLNKSGKQISLTLPEPTPFIPVKQNQFTTTTPTITPTTAPTAIPTTIEDKGGKKIAVATATTQTTKTETVCTPVYGMANSCAEHAVVDTALDTSIFFNLAGLSYFAGLAAFVKAKRKA